MSKASASPATAAPAKKTVKPPAKTNPVRLGALLAILVFAILMLAHHYLLAAPATQKAYDDIGALFKSQNAKGVQNAAEGGKIDAKLLAPKDVQALLNRQPWYVDTHPDYTVECYWWYGLPDRNYVTVLYYGNGDRLRFNTHYQNQKPDPEDLPNAPLSNEPPALPDSDPPPTVEVGHQKVEKPATKVKPADVIKPAEEKAAESTKPAEPVKPAEAKPEEKPAEVKPADDKPAETKPVDKE
ncbi:hypothetical protein ETAA8_48260 [Anatilimnocola aggregata]|uniref:Uncharacterized protein n=1 Tax=Anatilimnocola aggregata TaxID=2528021 RepID=A0A517YHL3_9BACT|nr:hypothetical protein [Anatilimnocola aggregata]QDU29711.1 hypothetical protein ETAA8_48260 [Anatilimnocola aggregata]